MNNNLGKIIGYTFVVLIIVYLIYTPPIRSAYYDLENVFNGTSIISLDSIILTSGIFLLGLFFGSGIFGWMQNKNFKKIVIILLGLLAISSIFLTEQVAYSVKEITEYTKSIRTSRIPNFNLSSDENIPKNNKYVIRTINGDNMPILSATEVLKKGFIETVDKNDSIMEILSLNGNQIGVLGEFNNISICTNDLYRIPPMFGTRIVCLEIVSENLKKTGPNSLNPFKEEILCPIDSFGHAMDTSKRDFESISKNILSKIKKGDNLIIYGNPKHTRIENNRPVQIHLDNCDYELFSSLLNEDI